MVPAENVWRMQTAERVRTMVARKRWSMVDLAHAAGLPYPSVYNWIVEHKRMPAWALVRLAGALEVSVDVLAGVV